MAHTTGPHTRGFVIVKEDGTGAWILCNDGCWMALEAAQAGEKPMATTVRLCRYTTEAWRYARRHTYPQYVDSAPRVISARAAGVPPEICR